MKLIRARSITFAVAALALGLCACLQAANDPSEIWPTFHFDSLHTGQNKDSKYIANPATIGAVWIFPRDVGGADEELTIVDDTEREFTPHPKWRDIPYKATDSWDTHFYFARPIPTTIRTVEIDNGDGTKTIRQQKAPYSPTGDTPIEAIWRLPEGMPRGLYQIYVWVPSDYPTRSPYRNPNVPLNTAKARYRVYDDLGAHAIGYDDSPQDVQTDYPYFSQQDGGGWRLLSPDYFSFAGTGDHRVVLSNWVGDYIPVDPEKPEVEAQAYAQFLAQNYIVVADAVRFVPAVGQEIYSSPTTAQVWYDWVSKETPSNGEWHGYAPFVYVGTVERQPSMFSESPDLGSVYCINSVTPTNQSLDSIVNPVDKRKFTEMSKLLGTAMWRYPSPNIAERAELEGPIEGGVYSSPTLARITPNPDLPAVKKLVCFVTGMDRQVYAFDAEESHRQGKPVLLWKGPGVTASEGKLEQDGWTLEPGMNAFGGEFRWVNCVAAADSGIKNVVWDFSGKLSDTGAPQGDLLGWSYAVYAWIPARKAGEPRRISDAVYTITYEEYKLGDDPGTGSASNVTTRITVDQSSPRNQGRWVKLGNSYFNVKSVALSNVTALADPATRGVVADAVMIVPDTIGEFSYSSPVYGKIGGTELVFATTSEGRLIGFNAMPSRSPVPTAMWANVGTARWIYPAVRTGLVAAGAAQMDQPSLGEIGATPAFDRDRLFVATLNGEIRSLMNLDAVSPDVPKVDWVFPNATDRDRDDQTGNRGEAVLGFTSSPTVDTARNQVFVASTGGVFYCLHTRNRGDNPNKPSIPASQLKWRYPEAIGNQDGWERTPLGAFRYSTPAIATVGGVPRVYCGSSDGKIYSFNASENVAPEDRRIWMEFDENGALVAAHGATWYYEPNVSAPIQGSVALDGGFGTGGSPIIFAGDMNGTLHWFSSRNGLSDWWIRGKNYRGWRTEGALFSSPNVSQIEIGSGTKVSWVYVGGADGRLYAFSDENGAWGGKWAGGLWPFSGNPNEDRSEEIGGPNTEIQFELFTGDFYRASENLEPEPAKVNNHFVEPKWPDDEAIPNESTYSGSDPEPVNGDPTIVGKRMKIAKADIDAKDWNKDGTTDDDDIDWYLLNEAKKRRRNVGAGQPEWVFEAGNRVAARRGTGIYFEWGETINIALWNLPELDRIRGSNAGSKRNSIKFSLTNTTAGESSGTNAPLSGTVKVLKEYTVLKEPALNSSAPYEYEAVKYSKGNPVKRCYALAQIEIRASSSRPPTPGPGWVLSATIQQKEPGARGSDLTPIEIRLARLKISTTAGVGYEAVYDQIDTDGDKKPDRYEVQRELVGINNPLAIRDDDPTAPTYIGWPEDGDFSTYATPGMGKGRFRSDVHYNGNAQASIDGSRLSRGPLPTLNLGVVVNGTGSREGWLGVMDRGASGCTVRSTGPPPQTDMLQRFRVTSAELRFNGGDAAISEWGGIQFPWDLGVGSVDYPSIYTRSQSYRKGSDDGDPSTSSTTLPAVALTAKTNASGAVIDYYKDYGQPDQARAPKMRPETVFVSVNVPRFQPPNGADFTRRFSPSKTDRHDAYGYGNHMRAYIDSDGNREFTSGNTTRGRPTTYQEAYREFKVYLAVPPDPRMVVEEQLIDIGRPPHGLGEALALTGNAPGPFDPFNVNGLIQQWFKRFTVKNAGNVNLYGLQVARSLNGQDVRLLSDQVSPTAPLPGAAIVSSLDGWAPFNAEPFTTLSTTTQLGYTLSKPRVGDPDPTILTIPDKRKWDTNYNFARTYAARQLAGFGWPLDQPLSPAVSIQVPLTQPIGTYASYNPVLGDGTVPVVAMFGDSTNPRLAVASPSFQLKVTVRESQLTGGVTPTTLPQIDIPPAGPNDEPLPGSGDTTPAAFRDSRGNVHLVWSTNRLVDKSVYPANPTSAELADLAGAPWFLNFTTLTWAAGGPHVGWQPYTPDNARPRWWGLLNPDDSPVAYLPVDQWPDPTDVMAWTIGGNPTDYLAVRHYSPMFAQSIDTDPAADTDATWLVWVGSADRRNPATNKIERDYAIFYTDASQGDLTSGAHKVYVVEQEPGVSGHDSSMEKRYPFLVVEGPRLWLFYQGGEKGAWSIYYARNIDPDRIHNPRSVGTSAARPWSRDVRLRTPDCLASVSSPNAIYRQYGVDARNQIHAFDAIYSGIPKLRQNSDVILSRYLAQTLSDQLSGSRTSTRRPAQPMPRVFNEKLERDPKFGFFTSRHLAWVRLDPSLMSRGQQAPVIDDWGGYDPAALDPDLPHIHVVLPPGYKLPNGDPLPNRRIISATDGGVWDVQDDGSLTTLAAPVEITPQIDTATGIYIYKYPQADAAAILGDMLADFSEGIVRFTKPLVEEAEYDAGKPTGRIIVPEVRADYTPQAWRLTTDLSSDSSPRAFLERTPMTRAANPGLDPKWPTDRAAPVDRLWVFWRKAGTGIESSTIFYSTYRVGIDLKNLLVPDQGTHLVRDQAPPVLWNTQANQPAQITVENAFGPWEVDRTGRYIYFSQIDERYPALLARNTNPAGAPYPGPVKIKYKYAQDKEYEADVWSVSWVPELQEQSLFGFAADSNVNEGSIYAFADPDPQYKTASGTFAPLPASKIWVFWTSTRAGTSDLFWETISPNFAAR